MGGKSIKRNYIYNTAYTILTILTAPYVSRVLEADGVGIISFAVSAVSYFGMFAVMGTADYGQREIAYCRDDKEKRSIVFWETVFLRLINTLIALSVYLFLVYSYAKSYRHVYFIYAVSLSAAFLEISWLFAGLEEFGKLALRSTAIRLLDVTFVFLLVKTKSDVPVYSAIYVSFSVAGALSMWRYVPMYIQKPDFKKIRPFRNIRTVWSLFLPSIAVQVYTVLDKTMIGLFTEGTFENGYYEQALKISKVTLALVTSLAGVMIPRIGYLFGKKDFEMIRFYMYRSYRFVLFLSIPLCFGLIGVSDNFVPWFFGPGYEKVAGLLKISSFIIICIGFSCAGGVQYLVPTKRQKLFTYSVTAGAITNFSLNIILIRMYQSYGAVVASVIAEIAVVAAEFYFIHKELSFRRIIISGVNYYISGALMLALLLFMNAELTPSVIHTAEMVAAGAAVYFSSLLILRDQFFLEYCAKALGFIRRKFLRRTENTEA